MRPTPVVRVENRSPFIPNLPQSLTLLLSSPGINNACSARAKGWWDRPPALDVGTTALGQKRWAARDGPSPSLPATLQTCLMLVGKVRPETPTKLLQPMQRLTKGKSRRLGQSCRVRQPESFSSPRASYETVNGRSRKLLSTLDGFELHRPVWRQ